MHGLAARHNAGIERTNAPLLKMCSAAFALFVVLVAPVQAKPIIALTIPEASAGSPMRYSYSTARVPVKATLVIQRAVGTAHRFKTVARLAHGASGSGTLAALNLGQYSFRIAAIVDRRTRHRQTTVVLAQQTVRARVFGTVTFAGFFNQNELTATLPESTFTYVFRGNSIETGPPVNLVTVAAKNNVCRSVHVDWVPVNYWMNAPPQTSELLIVQESTGPVSRTANDKQMNEVDAGLIPGQSWGINYAVTSPRSEMNGYVNGTLSCYARTMSAQG